MSLQREVLYRYIVVLCDCQRRLTAAFDACVDAGLRVDLRAASLEVGMSIEAALLDARRWVTVLPRSVPPVASLLARKPALAGGAREAGGAQPLGLGRSPSEDSPDRVVAALASGSDEVFCPGKPSVSPGGAGGDA